jgi:phosphopantothenoylcysteine decarboxylase/phosphopantothenate--cysteine ligase
MNPKNILVAVSGGVAAYKALDVVSAFRKQGHSVRVVMSDAATHFVQPTSFAAVSGQPVLTNMWPDHSKTLQDEYPHLYPATETDLFLLIPATANTMAKIAGGFGSDLLSTCCLSLPDTCQKVFCPSMNVEMWRNEAVQRNVRLLESAGWMRLGPDSGHLACGMTGEGRLRDPLAIIEVLTACLADSLPLSGQTVLILSGPTREHLDPIRFIGNPSSGLMGKALAEEVVRLGAKVIFVSGPVPEDHLPQSPAVTHLPVCGALEMLETARNQLQSASAILYVAAVADYRPETTHVQKLPKQSQPFSISLVPNPDIAATLNNEKPSDTFSIGFALQTTDGETQARRKLKEKGLDGIVLNYPDSMGSTSGHFSYLGKTQDDFEPWGALTKTETARRILTKLPHGNTHHG